MKKIKKILFNNWALKLFSLVAAFLLWLLVVQIDNPEAEKAFYNIPVKLVNTEVLTDNGKVYEILDKTDTVRTVSVTAPKSIRDELSDGDIVAEADFSKLTAVNTVEITFYSLRYNDRISEISGSNEILKLNIEEKKTKRLVLTVETTGEVEDGYMISGVSSDQNRIEIAGPASVVSQIVSAGVKVDVTDSSSDISTYANVILYDADGKEVSSERLTMNVSSVRVQVKILDTKTVPVIYTVMGEPASGYLFTGEITRIPESVTIAGTTAVLDRISEIAIPEEVLDITEQTEDYVTNINIADYLPDDVILADKSFGGKASVTVHIEPEASRNLNIAPGNIQISNVPAGYTVELDSEQTSYILGIKGLKAEIDQISAATLIGHIDMKAYMEDENQDTLSPGTHDVEVEFTLSENITIVQPLKVHIKITKLEEE
ncbi:MAG: YbbR-like domain-containing protein [Lachnospiraceae bacterium]